MKRIILMGIAIMAIFVSSCKKEEVETPKAINNVKEINKRTVVVSDDEAFEKLSLEKQGMLL